MKPIYKRGGKYNSTSSIYTKWRGMLHRCNSEAFQAKRPWYADCEVSEEFYDFSKFCAWAELHTGFNWNDWQLDKDVLVPGNKLYSRDTCVFLPASLNRSLHSKAAANGLPRGVEHHGRIYRINVGGKMRHMNLTYLTVEEASRAYKQIKKAFMLGEVALFKHLLDPRVVSILSNYEFKED